ncbi:MAG: hypothetical protein K8J09_13870 [Planctomycetes bacterium]|nr:hypothetical protein [Planctomycetota bacterium]
MSTTSKKLLDILNGLPAWPRFPNETGEWSREQIEARFPAWDLLPDSVRREMTVLHKDTWIVIGAGAFALVHEGSPTPVVGNLRLAGAEAREVVVRLQNRPAGILPPPTILEELVSALELRPSTSLAREPALVARNELQERMAEISAAVNQAGALADRARQEVLTAGGNPKPIDDLLQDPLLHEDCVINAVQQLRRAAPRMLDIASFIASRPSASSVVRRK